MQWTQIDEHYAQSDTGYRITISTRHGQSLHCAAAPPEPGNKHWILLGCWHGPDSRQQAKNACQAHAQQPRGPDPAPR